MPDIGAWAEPGTKLSFSSCICPGLAVHFGMNSECSRCFWTISSYSQKLTHDKDNSKKAFWVQPCCTESKDIQLSLWLCFASYSQGQWFLHRAGSFYLPSHRKAEWLWSTPGVAQLLVTRELVAASLLSSCWLPWTTGQAKPLLISCPQRWGG